jgi:DNA gyrase/topoisomerase IV subunit B
MTKKDYSAKDITVLEEIEHIQLNAGMYIGSTENPVHLLEESLDNALDEVLSGNANIIAVNMDTKNHVYAVLDNGRGIPISNNTPITISSKLFSGAKFQDRKSAYEIAAGIHGVGLVAVNALSSEYQVEVYRNNKYAKFEFINAKLKKKKIVSYKDSIPFSTKIQFKPSKKIFETLVPDIDRIRKRLTIAAAELPDDIVLVLNVDNEKEIFKLSPETFFQQYCLTNKETPILVFESNTPPEKFKVMMAYETEGSVAPKILSSVNLLPVDGGGAHINTFSDMLKDFFQFKAKKLDYTFQARDCMVGLRIYLSLSLKSAKFGGQAKQKLINRKSEFTKLIKVLKDEFESFVTKNPEFLEILLERFQSYRKKLDSKGFIQNNISKRASTKFTKLRDCTTREGELYIVEGESAAGSLIQARDPAIHAVLPLKGKSIPNITTKKDVLKNKEIEELLKALGTGIDPHFNLKNLRYNKIICATDADPDGDHIACMLSIDIAILTPGIIQANRYYIAQTPLYAINEKKIFIPLWTEKELEKAKKDNRNISRFKGLGELNPQQLKVCLLDKKTRHLIPVTYSNNIESLMKMFSSADEKRKLLGGG